MDDSKGYLGPLTSQVSLDADCTTALTNIGGVYYFGVTGIPMTILPPCYPSRYAIDSVFSPGLCPHGWTSACTVATSAQYISFTFEPLMTAVQCCPIGGYVCDGGVAWCSSARVEATFTTSFDYLNPTSIVMTTVGGITKITYDEIVGTNTYYETSTVMGKPILVAYKPTDSAVAAYFAGDASTSSPSAVGASTGSPTPSESTISASKDHNELSAGAKAAIGIAIPLVIIILALSAWPFTLYRRQGVTRFSLVEMNEMPGIVSKPELPARGHSTKSETLESQGATPTNEANQTVTQPYVPLSPLGELAELPDLGDWNRTLDLSNKTEVNSSRQS